MDNPQNLIQLSQTNPIILYDGECYLCDNTVQFILKRDRNSLFRFCSLQDAIRYSDLSILPDIANKNSVLLIHKGIISEKSDAVVNIMKLLGGWLFGLGYLSSILPKFFRNAIYSFIARNRYKWFGKSDTCLIPNPTYKSQFLKLNL